MIPGDAVAAGVAETIRRENVMRGEMKMFYDDVRDLLAKARLLPAAPKALLVFIDYGRAKRSRCSRRSTALSRHRGRRCTPA